LTPEWADRVCLFVRQGIGSEYSTREAVRSVIGGSDQWTRKQFCSRLVAQAYASAGIKFDDDPNYCAPADLGRSVLLTTVPGAVDLVSAEEAAHWVCGDDPAADYRLEKPFRPAAGPDTLKFREDCVEIRKNMGEPSITQP
jgi:hypothetical protein